MTKAVNPWELIHDKTISQLVFSYEMVLTEMRTHAKANRTIKEWVARLDFDRDEFVKSMLVKPDEPSCEYVNISECPKCNERLQLTAEALRNGCVVQSWTCRNGHFNQL